MAKNKNDYFKLLEQQIEYCVQASELLAEIVTGYSAEKIQVQTEQMHKIEHMADELHHEILTKLAAEFITPIDQEDILNLVQIIDDITDALDEIVFEFYMFHITQMPESAPELAKLVDNCIKALREALKEFKSFKKPARLFSLLVDVKNIESQADKVYVKAVYDLFSLEKDSKALIGGKEIYESFESCCDLCEHATKVIEQIIIKNT